MIIVFTSVFPNWRETLITSRFQHLFPAVCFPTKCGVWIVHNNSRPFLFVLLESWGKLGESSNLFPFWENNKSFIFAFFLPGRKLFLKKRRRPKGRSPFLSKKCFLLRERMQIWNVLLFFSKREKVAEFPKFSRTLE